MRILFIGNSHTHVGDVPGTVQTLLSWLTGDAVSCIGCSTDSVGLAWHWRSANTHGHLARGPFDFVVLQERSGGPIEEPESTRKHAVLWAQEIHRAAAQAVLYGTWALQDDVARQGQISRLYREIADATGALVAPVGDAWARARTALPDVRLYDEDGRHAAPAGSFLAAAVITHTLAHTLGAAAIPSGVVPGPSQVAAQHRAALFALARDEVAASRT